MKSPRKISYSLVIGNFFHICYLKMFETSKNSAYYNIGGVISDDIVTKWAPPLICSSEERKEVIDKIKYVDEAIILYTFYSTHNLQLIHYRFPYFNKTISKKTIIML